MPKQEVGSTKWLGNKMKAKGLQKLRWYCQMCQKQCRDENGFKCHRMSDGHQRQMQLFVQDPNRFMDEFSEEFEAGFMALLSHSYSSTRVLANTVYCDYISNRHHTHMNSTIWVTLSNFVQYLARTNQCKIDKTAKGWYLQYIDNSPEARLRAQQKNETDKHELDEAVRHEMLLQEQVQNAGEFQESEFTELQREEGDAPIAFSMGTRAAEVAKAAAAAALAAAAAVKGNVLDDAFQAHVGSSSSKAKEPRDEKDKADTAKRRKVEVQTSSSSEDGSAPWLAAGLVVKVMNKELANGKYHRKKGLVEKVHDQYTADIRMSESKDLIRLDQEMMETVIPNVGKRIRVVKGTHKGHFGSMQAVDFEGFCVTVLLENKTLIEGLGYEQVCKVDC